MYQPIFECVMGCHGCYLSESTTSRDQQINTDLIDEIFLRKRLSCKQLTISLDTLIEYPTDLILGLKWLWTLYKSSKDCDCKNVTSKSLDGNRLPELCITAFNFKTVQKWSDVLGYKDVLEFLDPLTICSLSNFPGDEQKAKQLRSICAQIRTILNYNKMAEWNTDKQPGFWNGIKYANQIHLVFKKNPLGYKQDLESLKNWTRIRNIILDLYPSKLLEDQCIQDSINKLETGYRCGAGINKIHVWPGNIVTGCPYDAHMKLHKNPLGKNNLYEEVLFSVKERKSCHSMDFCKIPNLLQSIKNFKEKVKQNVAINAISS